MQFEIPIFRQILSDTKVSQRELQVFRAAIEYLDVVEARVLKLLVIEQHLDLDRAAVSRALTSLVEQGYLCRTAQHGGPALLRVPLSRHECARSDDSDSSVDDSQLSGAGRRVRPRVVSRGVL
jgi:hypothetical protein